MYFLYSIALSLAFVLMLPLFLLRRQKYASGFRQRLGHYPEFVHDGRPVMWLHCVSVGETNAARPLVDAILQKFPGHRLVVSTTTKTGQELAQKVFHGEAEAIFYFPFDWKSSVRRAIENYRPAAVLLMETEIWPRFIREARASGAKAAIINGRLSARSYRRYSRFRGLIRKVLDNLDLALMQAEPDAERIRRLGVRPDRIRVTGNLKFDQSSEGGELTESFRCRFAIDAGKPLIVAASTHEPEERCILESLDGELGHSCRLLVAPRHPERFDAVARLLDSSPYSAVRRSDPASEKDQTADVILLDSIGELRSVYPLADIVFVGGSLIPHGGQNVIEPALEEKPIVTGPYTTNFDSVIREFLENDAIRQTPEASDDSEMLERLYEEFTDLLKDEEKRVELGRRAAAVVGRSNRRAVEKTIDCLRAFFE
jgi:3-deoxy-D-manno-octulosonic-acid transferase